MAAPVWVLSVDLQTKTATFQSGLADAARSARGAFTDIKSGASNMGAEVGYSMGEARHSVMILGEEFGVHLPRALTSFIASIGPLGGALEAAFPFLAIALGATLLIEHLAKVREEAEKLTDDQARFGIAVQSAFNTLEQKLLQAQIKSDELRNDHLGALRLQLELIDKASMAELVHSFEEVAKAAEPVLKSLEGSWYTFGKGSDGAAHALREFGLQYTALLDTGKDKDAGGLLTGTLQQAERVLALQKQVRDNSGTLTSAPKDGADVSVAMRAESDLRKLNAGYTDKEIAAQEQLVAALSKQSAIEQEIARIKAADSGNATRQTGNDASARRAVAARESAESIQTVYFPKPLVCVHEL